MKNKKLVTTIIPIKNIVPDKYQPRKNFDPARLAELMSSIKEHGILNPLIVEQTSGNNYILIDGERRYRAAQELGLKEVPARINEAQSTVERLIQQFHIQAQHEDWTAGEKARAVSNLAKELKMSVLEVAKLLSIPSRTIATYIGLANLIERESFEKSEVPLHFAERIVRLRTFAKRILAEQDEELTDKDASKFELEIIKRLKSGEIKKPSDFSRIKDAIKMNPKMIQRFTKDSSLTIQRMFIDSKAKVAFHYRNSLQNARYLTNNLRRGMELGMGKMLDENDIRHLTRAMNTLEKVLK